MCWINFGNANVLKVINTKNLQYENNYYKSETALENCHSKMTTFKGTGCGTVTCGFKFGPKRLEVVGERWG